MLHPTDTLLDMAHIDQPCSVGSREVEVAKADIATRSLRGEVAESSKCDPELLEVGVNVPHSMPGQTSCNTC